MVLQAGHVVVGQLMGTLSAAWSRSEAESNGLLWQKQKPIGFVANEISE